jgi:hypothetical protein
MDVIGCSRTQTQDCEETRGAAHNPVGAVTPIWLLWRGKHPEVARLQSVEFDQRLNWPLFGGIHGKFLGTR